LLSRPLRVDETRDIVGERLETVVSAWDHRV
jgi:hypothetical protein